VRFQLAAVITNILFIAEAFDNPVLEQIVFLFLVRYIFLLSPLYVSGQATVTCGYPEKESAALCLIIIAVCYSLFSSVKYRFKISRKQSASKKLNFLQMYSSRCVITPAEYSAETVISAEYLPNLNAKYTIRPSVPTSEMSERVNRNLFYFLCRVDNPTTCRAVIGHTLGVFGQLFDECRCEFIYNCDFAACL
jgi:hypothetical protein